MNSSFRMLAWPCLVSAVVLAYPSLRAHAAETTGAAQFHQKIQPLLEQYCYQCHGDGMSKGNIAFDELKSNDQILNHDLWSKVLLNTRSGLMPPRTEARPTPDEQKMLEDWVKYQAFGIDPRNPDPGRVTLRRLNREQYRNTIRDLMGVEFNTDEELPPDDTGYGFDDIGDVLTISPMLLEKYMKAASTIVEQGVPKVSKVIPQVTIAGGRFHTNTFAAGNGRNGGGGGGGNRGGSDTLLGFSYYTGGAASNTFNAMYDGSYKVSLELSVRGTFGFDPGKCHVIFKVDGQDLLSRDFTWEDHKVFPPFVFDQKWQKGPHRMTFEVHPLTQADQQVQNILEMRIDSVAIQGPLEEKYWSRPKNFDLFFTKDAPEGAQARKQYAREVFSKFASKAFRRPVDGNTVDRLVMLAESIYNLPGKTFEEGVGHAMVAVLASPRFLYQTEQAAKASSKDPYPLVDEYSLASRLSYFLWSSTPDDELFGLATRGQLRNNLPAEIKRMLADPRSEAMVDNFTGQWLQARDMDAISIDARTVLARDKGEEKQLKQQIADALAGRGQRRGGFNRGNRTNAAAGNFAGRGGAGQTNALVMTNLLAQANSGAQSNAASPAALSAEAQARAIARANFNNVGNGGFAKPAFELTGDVKQAMERETQMAFSTVMHEDRSVKELIESDYTFVNQTLAKAYGLTNANVTGTNMRRVDLPPGSPRGGILTEGTFLVVTSNPDRTSPVKRGLFVLNNILGSPPPPPPPNIPALEVAEKDIHDHEPTLRETLNAHRDRPECSACHSRLDPLGLAFENFDALGLWRPAERSQPIDPSGHLITGEAFKNVSELKHIIATDHRLEFYRTLTTKLMTYATGRGMEYYDTETVDQIVQKMDADDGRFSTLLAGIIDSAPFQKERRLANPTLSSPPQNSPALSANTKNKNLSPP